MRDKYPELFEELDVFFAENPKVKELNITKLDDLKYHIVRLEYEEV